ncbi:hypothetical protein HYH02_007673 [Chlamydomonas schloesseri]|uniref:3-beta hydroxysteroid dehydrogenase/isomerase domain-containing protein n=1 Tax=Chlamydomonas schloesseri TaxID=2026947 RepID=A0A835WGT9_9CHLO|nr:hypothetical protein HYH02_007673 [Chlamydomonas schloesseri]|eukprot:KAG2447344.1 hypothetical protein HYH02_007673 [Chlamydomonas schloesseri]
MTSDHSLGLTGPPGPLPPPPLAPPLPPPATPVADTTRRALITGGGGFLGFRLAATLARDGVEVTILDLAPPRQPLPPRVRFAPGSVADAAAVEAAFALAASPFPQQQQQQQPQQQQPANNASPAPLSTASTGAAGMASPGQGPGSYGGGCDGSPGLDAVWHVASYGMSGRELRDQAALIEAVNVGGSRHVAAACVRHGVPRLVYVSTCNVIFVGRTISGGDESAPYPPASAYKDAYSATKAQAERLVLAACGTALQPAPRLPVHRSRDKDGEEREQGAVEQPQQQPPQQQQGQAGARAVLRTCAVRSTGIWGPGETRHQPRVLRMVRQGVFVAAFGDPATLSDWIHVDNLVQILMLAERGLRTPYRPANVAADTPLARPAASGHAANGSGAAHNADAGGDGSQPAASNGNGSATGGSGHVHGGDSAAARGMVAEGQVYYASDGAPINNFLHFKPFIVGLGYAYPSVSVPYALVYSLAGVIEVAWPLLRAFIRDPPLTRMEVDTCCIEHWFCIDKARRELGFAPAEYDRREVVKHMAAEGWAAPGSALARRVACGGDADGGGSGSVVGPSVRWLVAGSVVALVAAVGVGYLWRR